MALIVACLVLTLLAVACLAIGWSRQEKRISQLEFRLVGDVARAESAANEADNKAWRAHLRIDRMQDGEKPTKQADWRDSAAFTAFDWKKPEQR